MKFNSEEYKRMMMGNPSTDPPRKRPDPPKRKESNFVGKIYYDENGIERDSAYSLNVLSDLIHQLNVQAGWWSDLETREPLKRNKGELLMLIVSEISECMEGMRKNLSDDKLPHRSMEEVELADALIRIFDYAGAFGLDLSGALREKLEYNRQREDHKIENRRQSNGKKF